MKNEVKRETDEGRSLKKGLYSLPEVYDTAFSWNLEKECDFLQKRFEDYADVEVRRILEPACGTGRLSAALAERDYEVLGYDNSSEMVEYCRARFKDYPKKGPGSVRIFMGEMTKFVAPEPCEAAINPINSLNYLMKNEEILQHYRCMHRSLVEGGLYIVQIAYNGQGVIIDKNGWLMKRDDLAVRTFWEILDEDEDEGYSEQRCRMIIDRNGERRFFSEIHRLRFWTPESFQELAEKEGLFELKGIYRDNFVKLPPGRRPTWRVGNLYHILKRKG